MKFEEPGFRIERLKRATQPVYIVEFFHIPEYGWPNSYPFSRVFSSGYVNEPLQPVLECIEAVSGSMAQIVPEQGRASIGGFRFDCVDLDGEVLKQFSSPQLTLLDPVTAGAPGIGDELRLDDVSGLPAFGTIEVGEGLEAFTRERIRYSAKDLSANSVTVSGRGMDGTTAQAAAVGAFVTNGEQIRSGMRCRLLSGYQSMPQFTFMESQRVEVVDRNTIDMIRASFTIDTADITRALRREVFLTATQDAPFVIGGHPLTIALQVLMSTGDGRNGLYDVLAAENGLGIHPDFIDLIGIEAARDEFPSDGYCFTITGPEMAKGWLEDQIFKTINAYPLVLQDGRLTIRLYTPVLT